MAIDTDKIDDAVLALLVLTLHDGWRAWKGFDWDALDRLHEKGMIDNPRNRNKSVVFTDEGLARAKALLESMFSKAEKP
jgi:hypothetical protein